jgi:hypothetical protein
MEALMEFGLVIPLGMTPLFANKLFYWSFFDFSWLDWQREDKENKVRFFPPERRTIVKNILFFYNSKSFSASLIFN